MTSPGMKQAASSDIIEFANDFLKSMNKLDAVNFSDTSVNELDENGRFEILRLANFMKEKGWTKNVQQVQA